MAWIRQVPRVWRQKALRAWRDGASVEDAAAVVGVSDTALQRWIDQCGGVVDTGVTSSGRYLSLPEREELAVLWAQDRSKAYIARALGRHPTTIGRELRRNRLRKAYVSSVPGAPPRPVGRRPGSDPLPAHERLQYRALNAQARADGRAARPKPRVLAARPELAAYVQDRLGERWSPEQIAAALPGQFPHRPEMRVSHETIYQALYVQGRGGLRRELHTALRTGRALRVPHARADARRTMTRIPGMVNISQRPAEAADRAVPGHWEGDLILGTQNKTAIGTLVERSTRFVILLHLPGRHGAEEVRDAMIPAITALPEHLRRSLTWDQGAEMTRHTEFSIATGVPVFFCDPHSPWQRGTNENTNGLLRQYFPKAMNLAVYTPEQLAAVAAELNARPRKTLGWQTPAQALTELLSPPPETSVATTG